MTSEILAEYRAAEHTKKDEKMELKCTCSFNGFDGKKMELVGEKRYLKCKDSGYYKFTAHFQGYSEKNHGFVIVGCHRYQTVTLASVQGS